MTYYGGKELANAFRTVRKNTIQIAEDIPEDKYDFAPAAGARSVKQTLAHIATLTTFPTMLHGERIPIEKIDFMEYMKKVQADEATLDSKAKIVAALKARGEAFAKMLEALNDEKFFAESITFRPGATPPSRTRFDLLLAAKEHEMHHRGQLMLIQRMLGITPHLTREQQARMAQMQAAAKVN
ncbi:MAG TPA: DinB family protein [Vicinamibacterales bacterium]|nr:DinB family protein [Vicinamibacterales bacterium]